MSTFLIIDYFRNIDFSIVLGTRMFILASVSILMALSYKKKLTYLDIRLGILTLAILDFGGGMITATFARMPPYYLTNLLFLIMVLVVTASGLNFRNGLVLNMCCLAAFIFFSLFIKREPFYFTQYPHLIVIFIYIEIVGIVLEHRRRSNFRQFVELREQKKIVEDLNQQKNKIISILSHDLSVPMNSLSILLHLQSTGNISEGELKPFLNNVGSQLNNVTSMLQNLVRWSRSQMQGFSPDKKLVDLNQYVSEGIALFQTTATQKGLSFAVNSERPLMVFADEEMLKIAIRNLISNAVKFATENSTITIMGNRHQKNARIKVANRGEPIPVVLREKLFTYLMPSSQDTTGAKGTGLGLAVAAYFVRVNGGTIYLEPPDDQNMTSFCMTLPEAASQEDIIQTDRLTSNFSK